MDCPQGTNICWFNVSNLSELCQSNSQYNLNTSASSFFFVSLHTTYNENCNRRIIPGNITKEKFVIKVPVKQSLTCTTLYNAPPRSIVWSVTVWAMGKDYLQKWKIFSNWGGEEHWVSILPCSTVTFVFPILAKKCTSIWPYGLMTDFATAANSTKTFYF